MPPRKKVQPQKKQTLKQKVATVAGEARDHAAAVAAAAVAVGKIQPQTAPVVGPVAVVAGTLFVLFTVVQKLAGDPPRDDFDQVWVSGAAVDESALPDEEPQRAVVRFAAQQTVLMDNMTALVISLERYDGAVDAGDDDAADTQADAVQQNADAAAAAQQTLQDLAPGLNDAWRDYTTQNPPDFDSVTLDDFKQWFLDHWGDPPDNPAQSPSSSLQSLIAAVTGAADDVLSPFDVGMSHPILEADEVPGGTSSLIGDAYSAALADAATELSGLVVEEE